MRHLTRALIVIIGSAAAAPAQSSSKASDAAFAAAYAKVSEAYRQADAQAVAALYTDDSGAIHASSG